MAPLVSAVIVNHNYGRYIAECIDSVLAQTYHRIETIVVDDGSTDHSLEVLRRYSNRVVVVRQSNKGVSAARNAGIAMSTGEWIAFLDADDVWLPEKIANQSEHFHDAAVGIIFCGLEYTDESGDVLGYSDPSFTKDPLRQLATFTNPAIGGGSTAAIRMECLHRVGGFDEALSCCEDLELWIRIAAEYEIRTIRKSLVKYRRHCGSLSCNVKLFEQMNDRMLKKLFSDPKYARIHHLRRRAWARFYVILAGFHFHDRNLWRAVWCALRGILSWPLEIGHLCSFPIRVLRRLMASSKSREYYVE